MRMTQKNAVSFLLTLIVVTAPVAARAQTASITLESGLSATFSGDAVSAADDDAHTEKAQETVQDTLLGVCTDHGYGKDCAKLLMGMMWQESNNRYNVVGDHGLALGYYQIHYKMHKVSTACVTDLKCSAEWTLNYMEKHSYPQAPMYAVQCHNSCNVANGYAAKAVRHGNRLWDEPMLASQPTSDTVQVAININRGKK